MTVNPSRVLQRGQTKESLMKALSIRQPWCWLILHAGKDIENRSWRATFRGAFLIHASGRLDGTREQRDLLRDRVRRDLRVEIPPDEALERSGIIGGAIVTDVVEESSSPWFEGPYGLVLGAARPLPFRECTGQLGFFEVTP
jgi:hypothetical protein